MTQAKVNKAKNSCIYGSCLANITEAKLGLCSKHAEMLDFILWAINKVKVQHPGQPASQPPPTMAQLISAIPILDQLVATLAARAGLLIPAAHQPRITGPNGRPLIK